MVHASDRTGSGSPAANSAALRLFVAVPLPDSIRSRLQEVSRKLRPEVPLQKWTHSDDLHITVQFLGETLSSKLDALQQALREAAAAHAGFPLSLAGLGTFGPPARPSILWAGLEGHTAALEALHHSVVAAMAKQGYKPEDRPFRPHITLGRRYNGSHPFQRTALAPFATELSGYEWTADRLTLYRSHLGRTPMYEKVAEFPLLK